MPRVQFLTWASGAREVEPQRSSFAKFTVGEEIQRKLNKPYGIAVKDGVVYVCDTKALDLSRLDFKNHTFTVLGNSGPGRLRKPINVAIDDLNYKFVVDPYRRQVVVFGPDDKYLTGFDVPQPCRPVDVAIHGNELFVLDNDDTCQIVVMDRQTGKVLRTFGSQGKEPGQFQTPASLCIGPEGYLYVSDTINHRIQKLTLEGKVIWTRGNAGYRLGQFGRTRGIRIGPDGILYVVEGAMELVQMFAAKDGQILMRFGGPGDTDGGLVLPSSIAIDTTSIPYFQKYVHRDFKLKYLLFVASQYGRHLVNVFGFGSFPEGYQLAKDEIVTLEPVKIQKSLGDVEESEKQAAKEAAEGGATENKAGASKTEGQAERKK